MATIGICMGIVKIAGAAKVVFSARAFGVTDGADAYFIAFLVVSFFGDTLAGSLHSAMLPTFVESREIDGLAAAQRLYQSVMARAAAVLFAVALALFLTAHWAMRPFASSFDVPKLALTCSLFRVMLPMLPIAAIATVWRSVLNTEGRFVLPTLSVAATPLVTIVFLWKFAATWGVYSLAVGSTVGAIIEASALGAMMLHRGFTILPRWYASTAALAQVLAQYWPVLAGIFLLGGAPLIDQSIAAMLGAGSVSALQYGTRVTVVLTAIGPGAVATAIFPHFSKLAVDGADVRHSLRSYAVIILTVTIPVIAGLIAFSEPIVRLFFQRGEFDVAATHVVASVQRYSLLQIPSAMVMALVLRLISSMKANHLLLTAALLFGVLNLTLDLALSRWMGVSGIALSSAITQLITMLYLVVVIRTRLPASLNLSPSREAVSR